MESRRCYSDEEIDRILEDLERRTAKEGPSGQEETAAAKPKRNRKHEIWEWIRTLTAAGLVSYVLFFWVFRVISVQGPSMEPTLQEGDRLVTFNLFCEPKPGDIVVTSDQNGLQKRLVKRVIAVGGQEIEFRDGQVYVEGNLLTEPYLAVQATESGAQGESFEVPEGFLFVMGDNRDHSTDSRSSELGFVPEEEIVGRVVFRLLPLGRAGPVE